MTAQIKKTDTTKMSLNGKVAKKPKSRVRKILRAVLWGLLVLAVLIVIALALIWHNRTRLMEGQIRKLMAKQGYDVALDIQKLSTNRAIITDISVSKKGDVFFKSERAIIDYDYGKRMAQRIELVRPYINVAFDTKGKITSRWMPPSSGNGEAIILPPDGLIIDRAVVDWQLMLDADTTLGAGQANITADIKTNTDWNANISGAQNHLSTAALSGNFENDIFIETNDGKSFDIFGSVDIENLNTDLLFLSGFKSKRLNSQFKLNYTLDDKIENSVLSGWYHAKIKDLFLQDYAVGAADIKVDDMTRRGDGQISANWQISAKAAQISNDAMRKGLADRLTSHSALAQTPIAQYFTGTIYSKAERLLSGFELEGNGTYIAGKSGYKIGLDKPLRLSAEGQKVEVTRNKDGFITYNKGKSEIQVGADIDWSGTQALKLTDFSLGAHSKNGARIDAVNSIESQVDSIGTWRLHSDGEDVRLAPFGIDFAYKDQGSNIRNVRIGGGIDYDGPVPGGSVKGLKADGAMDLRMHGQNFTLGYRPAGPLSIAGYTNPSGWMIRDLEFTMAPQENLLTTTASARIMRTVLKDVGAQIIDPQNKRHLDAQFKRLDIETNFANAPQHWQIGVSDTDIKSEDFPAPGTHIISKNAMLNVYQKQSGDMTFDLLSPHTQVATNNAKIRNLHIGLTGSPDDIALNYKAGSVTMVGGAVPVLPMHGTARLKAGELTGHAITNLPKTKNTPIDIHYRSKDGQGSAKILIPKIIFDPRGLQPQQLIPVLRGKLAEVTGETSAEFDFVFGGGRPVQSSGWAALKNLDIGTLVGPLSGVNAKLNFTSVFPMKTDGIQTVALSVFDPGFPLKNGIVKFETLPDGIRVHQAAWPIDNIEDVPGKIFLTPMDWKFGDVENRAQVNVENVGLGTILAGIGKDKLSATGQVFGTLPAIIKGVDVHIDNGVLAVKDGGIIRFNSTSTDAAAQKSENAGYAFQALENFQYKQLEARIDGPIDGAMALKIVFDGQNPEVLSGQTFQFNTVVSGELASIARNMAGAFSNEENLSRIMEIKNSGASEHP